MKRIHRFQIALSTPMRKVLFVVLGFVLVQTARAKIVEVVERGNETARAIRAYPEP